jgi:hypothetical protein
MGKRFEGVERAKGALSAIVQGVLGRADAAGEVAGANRASGRGLSDYGSDPARVRVMPLL